MSRGYASAVSAIFIGLVLFPVRENWKQRPTDSFPLSYYPMFTHDHADVQSLAYVVGIHADGRRSLIRYSYCGSGGLNQVRKQLWKTALAASATGERFCRRVARAIERRADPELADLAEVRLVSGRFSIAEYFTNGNRQPLDERIHAAYTLARVEPVSLEHYPTWIRKHLSSRSWAVRPRPSRLDRGVLEESLRLGRQFTISNQKAEGNFHYQYDFVQREVGDGDDQVRQAGATWGLALMYQHEQDEASRAALDRALAFFLEHTRAAGAEGALLIAYPGQSDCATGTVALTALAIIDYLRTAGEGRADLTADYRQRLEAALDGYLAHLCALRLSNGRFSRSCTLNAKMPDQRSSPHFDGEALLCLVKAAKYLGRVELVPLIESSALAMAKYYTADQWADEPDSDQTKGAFQWCSMAFWEIQDAGWRNAEAFADCVLSLAWWMIHTHATLARQRNTAYAYEGLILAHQIAQSRGDEAALRDLAYTIDEGLFKLTSWQVGGPLRSRNRFLMENPTTDPRAVGGVMNHEAQPMLRIDLTQHQMSAVILALKYVYPQPTAGPP